jgi:hypothetical protein
VEVLDYEELGMEAVWKIDVVDFPAFIVVDDKGNDFFAETSKPLTIDEMVEDYLNKKHKHRKTPSPIKMYKSGTPKSRAAIILAYNVCECEMRAKTAWHGELSIVTRLCKKPVKPAGTQ